MVTYATPPKEERRIYIYIYIYTCFGDLGLSLRSQGCWRGSSVSCIFWIRSLPVKVKLCMLVTYMDKIKCKVLFADFGVYLR